MNECSPPTHTYTDTHTDLYCCQVVPFAIINNCSMRDFLLLFLSFTSRMFLLLPLSVSLHLPTFCAFLYWLSISLRFTICRLLVGSGTHKHAQPQLSSVHSCCVSSSSFCGSRFSAYFAAECVLLLFLPLPPLSPLARLLPFNHLHLAGSFFACLRVP